MARKSVARSCVRTTGSEFNRRDDPIGAFQFEYCQVWIVAHLHEQPRSQYKIYAIPNTNNYPYHYYYYWATMNVISCCLMHVITVSLICVIFSC